MYTIEIAFDDFNSRIFSAMEHHPQISDQFQKQFNPFISNRHDYRTGLITGSHFFHDLSSIEIYFINFHYATSHTYTYIRIYVK